MRSAPCAGQPATLALFVGCFCIILSMYGGGFATIPAYLADMFGTQMVGAIHGRLLTAWSTAGVLRAGAGELPARVPACQHGVPNEQLPTTRPCTSWPACWSLGFVCNLLVRPVAAEMVHDRRRSWPRNASWRTMRRSRTRRAQQRCGSVRGRKQARPGLRLLAAGRCSAGVGRVEYAGQDAGFVPLVLDCSGAGVTRCGRASTAGDAGRAGRVAGRAFAPASSCLLVEPLREGARLT